MNHVDMPVDFPDDKPAARGCAIQNWALLKTSVAISPCRLPVCWATGGLSLFLAASLRNLELGDYWMAVYRYDLQLGPITGGCLVSVERALYIYPIGEVTRLPFEWYCRCQKARLVHHTCKSATRALWYIKCSLNDFRASWLL